MIRIGDLVTGTPGTEFENFLGVVFGFDVDGDPIIKWAGCTGSWERAQCGEYGSQIERAR